VLDNPASAGYVRLYPAHRVYQGQEKALVEFALLGFHHWGILLVDP
jgi:hypothetical protein